MTARPPFSLPDAQQTMLRRARRLEWITIASLLVITAVMYLAMGSSQAMKTAWIEDVLSLIPPALFLTCSRVQQRPPSRRFPFGFLRVMTVAFVAASASLVALGLYLLISAVLSLVKGEHPTIGAVDLWGHTIWMGWLMLAALAFSVAPPVILGRLKLKPARELHDKTLRADADMNKADWTTGLAAMLGVIGIGFGLWWADATAAAAISLSVIHDGVDNLRRSLADACDHAPTKIDSSEPDPLIEELRAAISRLPFVRETELRLRNEGVALSGEAIVTIAPGEDVGRRLREIEEAATSFHWRVHDVVARSVTQVNHAHEG